MKIFKRILLLILLAIPAVKFAQSQADQGAEHIENQTEEVHSQLEKDEFFQKQQEGVTTQDQVNRAGGGRVYVYYGTGGHRPYRGKRYYYRRGYPYGPYYYRYYYYPYQRPTRFYKRGW